MQVTINGWQISQSFGVTDRPFHMHQGIDFAIPLNTPIPSIGDGIVTAITDEGTKSFGRAVHVQLSDGSEVIYAHLSKFNCQVGDHVSTGSIIGYSGSTGDSTGPHLHLAVLHNGHAVDPTPYIQAAGGWVRQQPTLIGDGINELFLDLGKWLHESMTNVINMLNANSAEIIGFGIVVCAFGMMVAPFIGSTTGKWAGRAMGVFWVGVVWRAIV